MIDKYTFSLLGLAHGSFNMGVVIGFLYQGLLGLRIRKNRTAGIPDPKHIRKHRKMGPLLAILGVMGFLAGKTLVYLEHGHFLEFPMHYGTGATIVLVLIATFLSSRRIRGASVAWRNRHFRLGLVLLFLYMAQVVFGLGIVL